MHSSFQRSLFGQGEVRSRIRVAQSVIDRPFLIHMGWQIVLEGKLGDGEWPDGGPGLVDV